MADNFAATFDSVHLVLTGSEATAAEAEAESESEEKETLLILLTPIPSSFNYTSDSGFWFTRDRNAPCASDFESASDCFPSVNQPLGKAGPLK